MEPVLDPAAERFESADHAAPDAWPRELARAFVESAVAGASARSLQGALQTQAYDETQPNGEAFAERPGKWPTEWFRRWSDEASSLSALQSRALLQLADERSFACPLRGRRAQERLERFAAGAEEAALAFARRASALPPGELNAFARQAFALIRQRLLAQAKGAATGDAPQISLYRAFDALDVAFGLDYAADASLRTDLSCRERLYEGTGAGVQTSYASIVLGLELARLPAGGSLIDLGSGYGRVGLATASLRSDARFIGYEYVPHRSAAAAAASARAGFAERASFLAQDLACASFALPEADAFYLYDPFTRDTYRMVFERLLAMGERREISVVIKGNGHAWFADAIAGREWSGPELADEGTIRAYRSIPRR